MAAEGEFQCGIVVCATFRTVSNVLHSCDSIASWAPAVVKCCVVENGMSPSDVGCARRCLLPPRGGIEHRVLRETLVIKSISECRAHLSLRLTGAHAGQAADDLAPPGVPLTDMLTTLSVCPMATDPNKCFVEMYVTFAARTSEDVPAVAAFLETEWVHPQLDALAAFSLGLQYPTPEPVASPDTVARDEEIKTLDDTFCDIAGTRRVTDASVDAVQRMMDLLRGMSGELAQASQQVEHLRNELHAARLIHDQDTKRILEMEAANGVLEREALLARHQVPAGETVPERAAEAPKALTPTPPVAAAAAEKQPSRDDRPESAPSHRAGAHTRALTVPAHAPPRRPVSTYRAVETSEDTIRLAFKRVDPQRRGYLTVEQVAKVFEAADHAGDDDIDQRYSSLLRSPRKPVLGDTSSARGRKQSLYVAEATAWMKRHCKDCVGMTMDYDEFALLQCQFAQR